MFKIEMLVEEKKLGKVYWLLDGSVVSITAPIPIRGVKLEKGQPKSVSGNKTTIEVVVEFLTKNKIVETTTRGIGEILEGAGFKPDGASNVVYRMKKDGLLRRVASGRLKVALRGAKRSKS